MFSLFVLVLFHIITCAGRNITFSGDCTCGFHDPHSNRLYTESIILYFNETTGLDPNVFEIRNYELRSQKGWNVLFPKGASPENIGLGNNDSLAWQNAIDGTASNLEMFLNAPTADHLSDGAEIMTWRQDILYGSFRASMRSAQPWSGGSSMSMYLQYNDSQSLEMDMLNMDAATDAKILQTINGEYPDNELAINYTIIQKGDPPKLSPQSPWDFLELRFDWTMDTVEFWIEQNKTRSVTKQNRTVPQVPQALYFSHWSTGDSLYMQGPPPNRSVANVQWIRAFFNSSTMTLADHNMYNQRCDSSAACSIEDISLRGSSGYSAASRRPWKHPELNQHIRDVAGYVAAAFSFFGIASLLNAFIRRTPWYKVKERYLPGSKRKSMKALRESVRASIGSNMALYGPSPTAGETNPGFGMSGPGIETPAPGYTSRYATDYFTPGIMTPLPAYASRRPSMHSLRQPQSMQSMRDTSGHSRSNSVRQLKAKFSSATMRYEEFIPPLPASPLVHSPAVLSAMSEERSVRSESSGHISIDRAQAYNALDNRMDIDEDLDTERRRFIENKGLPDDMKSKSFMNLDDDSVKDSHTSTPAVPVEPSARKILKEKVVPDGMMGAATIDPTHNQPAKPQTQQRIDYLAGLVAISCVAVTLRHFSLTFWPYVTESQGPTKHFAADQVLSAIIGPYLLTPLWIGPFFVTSCRFLAQKYLKTGKLDDIGQRMLLRAPRMLIPCFVFMILEYFLLSLGLTARLEWLPSVSWSTWPYVQPQSNFGVFLNEIVELTYIIPNAAPEIINHYCVGVLWTIPVQLQFSFVTLLATVLIKDIKKPWKRGLFYTATIVAGWYASSWSACHWLGLLFADLDITFHWIQWAQAKWWRLYPILFSAFLISFATPLVLLFNSDFYVWSFMSWENGIHPDPTTGEAILQTFPTTWDAYPNYNAPSLAVLTFSVGLQVIVELSTWVQKVLSTRVIIFLHPHIMTIYLMHGFVFWSLGSLIAVALRDINVPYWAILLITAVCCYAVIFFFAILITPLIEMAVKGTTKNILRWATEEPVPNRATTAPFTKALVSGRTGEGDTSKGSA